MTEEIETLDGKNGKKGINYTLLSPIAGILGFLISFITILTIGSMPYARDTSVLDVLMYVGFFLSFLSPILAITGIIKNQIRVLAVAFLLFFGVPFGYFLVLMATLP